MILIEYTKKRFRTVLDSKVIPNKGDIIVLPRMNEKEINMQMTEEWAGWKLDSTELKVVKILRLYASKLTIVTVEL